MAEAARPVSRPVGPDSFGTRIVDVASYHRGVRSVTTKAAPSDTRHRATISQRWRITTRTYSPTAASSTPRRGGRTTPPDSWTGVIQLLAACSSSITATHPPKLLDRRLGLPSSDQPPQMFQIETERFGIEHRAANRENLGV